MCSHWHAWEFAASFSTPLFPSCVPSSQEKTEAERQRVFSKFEGLRLFLEDHARHLLAQLGDLERDIEKMQEENVTSLTKEISRLDTLIQEMEEKCQQPASKFLQVRGKGMEPGYHRWGPGYLLALGIAPWCSQTRAVLSSKAASSSAEVSVDVSPPKTPSLSFLFPLFPPGHQRHLEQVWGFLSFSSPHP